MTFAFYKHFGRIRTVFYSFLAMGCLLSAAPAALAEETYEDVYTVEGVEVDVTAENAVKARTQALDEAQIEAYKILAGRLLGPDGAESRADPDPLTAGSIVQDFEVTNEQLSSVRYKGTFTVRFRPRAADRHFNVMGADGMQDTAFAYDAVYTPDGSSVPTQHNLSKTLVLPFYQTIGGTTIWDEQRNRWMAAWHGTQISPSLIIPMGDALDVGQIRNDQALTYNYDFLTGMMRRYGAERAVILIAAERGGTPTQMGLEVNSYSANLTGPAFMRTVHFKKELSESDRAFFSRVVRNVAADLLGAPQPAPPNIARAGQPASQTDNRTMPPLGALVSYRGRAVFENAREWVELKKALEKASGTQSVTVKGLQPRIAEIELSFAGDPQRLSQVMALSGVAVRAVKPTDTLGRIIPDAPALFEFSKAPGQESSAPSPYYR